MRRETNNFVEKVSSGKNILLDFGVFYPNRLRFIDKNINFEEAELRGSKICQDKLITSPNIMTWACIKE